MGYFIGVGTEKGPKLFWAKEAEARERPFLLWWELKNAFEVIQAIKGRELPLIKLVILDN